MTEPTQNKSLKPTDLRTENLDAVAIPEGVELRRESDSPLAATVRKAAIAAALVIPPVIANGIQNDNDRVLVAIAAGGCAFTAFLATMVLHVKHEVYDTPAFTRVLRSLRIERPTSAEGYRGTPPAPVFTVDGVRVASDFDCVVVTGSAIVTGNPLGLQPTVRESFHVVLLFRDAVVRLDTFASLESAIAAGDRVARWLDAPADELTLLHEPAIEHSGAAMKIPTLLGFVELGASTYPAYVAAGVAGALRPVAVLAAMALWAVVHVMAHRMSLKALRDALGAIGAKLRADAAQANAGATAKNNEATPP